MSAQTVGHAIGCCIARWNGHAETISRNVAHAIKPPKVEGREIESLTTGQMSTVIEKLAGHPLQPLVMLALATGMSGELLALRWGDINLNGASVRVERSLEETGAGLRFKSPKTRHGKRTISLPKTVIEPMRSH